MDNIMTKTEVMPINSGLDRDNKPRFTTNGFCNNCGSLLNDNDYKNKTERHIYRCSMCDTSFDISHGQNIMSKLGVPITPRMFSVEMETIKRFDSEPIRIPDEYSGLIQRDDDGSIEGDEYCISGDELEFKIGPISGNEQGYKIINDIVSCIRRFGYRANASCGLHIHVNVSDFIQTDNESTFNRILKKFSKVEDSFFSITHPSRKKCYYCRSIKGHNFKNIRNYDRRYHSLNVLSYERHGTLEFRLFAGCTDPEKVTNICRLCVDFIDKVSKEEKITKRDLFGAYTNYWRNVKKQEKRIIL